MKKDNVVALCGNRSENRKAVLDDRGVWTVERMIGDKVQQFMSFSFEDANQLAEKAVEQATVEAISK